MRHSSRSLAWALTALLGLPLWLWAQNTATFQALTVDNTTAGVALAATTLRPSGGAQMAYCEGRVETAQIRFRDDGGTVSTTAGTLLEVGDLWRAHSNATARASRFIRTGATSGTLQVRCYEQPPIRR